MNHGRSGVRRDPLHLALFAIGRSQAFKRPVVRGECARCEHENPFTSHGHYAIAYLFIGLKPWSWSKYKSNIVADSSKCPLKLERSPDLDVR